MKTSSVTFRLDVKLRQAVEIAAQASGRSLSKFIVRALEEAVTDTANGVEHEARVAQLNQGRRDIKRLLAGRK